MSIKNNKYQVIGWLICGLGALYYAYEYLLRISPSVMEPQLRTHFNLSASGFGLLSAFYYYAYVPMQLPVGVLMDRFGPKRLLTFACLSCVVGTMMFAGTPSFAVSATGRFLVGFGSAFAFVGVLKLATLWLPEDQMALVTGLASALGVIGAITGDYLLGSLVLKFGWQSTVFYSAIFGIGLTLLLWFGIHDHKQSHDTSGTIDSFKKNMIDLAIIIRNPQIWINGFYGCLVYLPTTVFAELWGIPYLRNAHHLSEVGAQTVNSMLFWGFMIGAPIMGFISDRISRRKPPMLVGACGAAIIMAIVLYMPGLTQGSLMVLMLILGMLYSSQAIVFAVGRELSPDEAAGTAIATTNMIVMIGAMFFQPLVGGLLDWSMRAHTGKISTNGYSLDAMCQLYTTSDYRLAMSIIPVGILIAAILTFFLKETYAEIKEQS